MLKVSDWLDKSKQQETSQSEALSWAWLKILCYIWPGSDSSVSKGLHAAHLVEMFRGCVGVVTGIVVTCTLCTRSLIYTPRDSHRQGLTNLSLSCSPLKPVSPHPHPTPTSTPSSAPSSTPPAFRYHPYQLSTHTCLVWGRDKRKLVSTFSCRRFAQ